MPNQISLRQLNSEGTYQNTGKQYYRI